MATGGMKQEEFESQYVNQIICGDCLEVMRDWPDGCVDLVLTDPPYGVGKAEWDIEFPTEWIKEGFRLSKRILCMSGNSALIKAGNAFGDKYKDCIVMNAVNGMTRSKIAFGKWFPVLAAGDWAFEGRPNLMRFTMDGVRDISHPCPKPLNSMLPLIHWYSKPNDLILDPFCGSGTTCVAAKMLGRRYIGIDISEEYCQIARERLKAVDTGVPVKEAKVGQLPMFAETG
jgi:site-specific DNA-methyltransferase (adenine-specific)